MEPLCDKMQPAKESGQDPNSYPSPFSTEEIPSQVKVDEAGTSGQSLCATGEMPEDMAVYSDSEDALENRRKLLAEIRSCFRILSIHSRLCGNESPRTRRITTQANNRQSLRSLAMESSVEITCPGYSEAALGADAVQSCILYNQLVIGPPILTPGVGLLSDDPQDMGAEITEPCSENIHQISAVNPTSQLKTKEDLSKSDVMKVVDWLYRDHPGPVWRAASREAMAEQENRDSLIYGEVSFVAFAKLMEKYCPKKHLTSSTSASASDSFLGENVGFNFYDLGCGGGRCVFMASLLNTNCAKACGIEIVPGMHKMNQVLMRLYHMEVHPYLHALKQAQQLEFLLGDFLEIDWSDADVIFTNATCFEDPLFLEFEDMAARVLKPGAIVISVARFFSKRPLWDLLEEQERRMSWASATVYVYRKK